MRRFSPPDLPRPSRDGRGSVRPPVLPTNYPFALMQSAKPGIKPWVYPDMEALARGILRRRHGQALQLRPDRIIRPGRKIRVVAIYGLDQVGNRTRFIGYAWIGGRDWTALSAALAAIEPPMSEAA